MIHTRLTNACMSRPAHFFSVLLLHILYSNIGPEIQTAQNKNTRIANLSFEKKTLSKVINSNNECTFPPEENNDLNNGVAFLKLSFTALQQICRPVGNGP